MSKKHKTPLAYLMALLDVSLRDMSEYLYVAQTSISKWKTGARPLRSGSEHFAGIVEYFGMLMRDEERGGKLRTLLERLYPGADLDTPEAVAKQLRVFLQGNYLPVDAEGETKERDMLYTAQVEVYSGAQGYETALSRLGALMLAQPRLVTATVFCRGETEWLSSLLPALDAGHRLRLMVTPPEAEAVFAPTWAVFAHPRTEVRRAPDVGGIPPGCTLAVTGREWMLAAHVPVRDNPYAAVCTDAISVRQGLYVLEGAFREAGPLFDVVVQERRIVDRFMQENEASLDERIDFYAPQLPSLTMQEGLLMEVLRQNGVSGKAWSHAMAAHDAFAGRTMRFFVPARTIENPPEEMGMLSMLCGRAIHLTPAQRVRHMLDTAARLRGGGMLSVVPIPGAPPDTPPYAFVRRNAYAGYIALARRRVLFTGEGRVVEAFARAMDALIPRVTSNMKNPAFIAGILERAALDMEKNEKRT